MSSRSKMSDMEEDDEEAAGLSPISEINSNQGILDLNKISFSIQVFRTKEIIL